MPDAYSITFDPRAQDLIRRLRDVFGVGHAIAAAMDHENQFTVASIVENRLSFPASGPTTMEGLRVHTNRLRGSIRATAAEVAGRVITSAIGSNVAYAGVHEFGFQGVVQVREHTRRNVGANVYEVGGMQFTRAALTRTQTAVGFSSSGPITKKFNLHTARQISSAVKGKVRAHSRKANFAARHYIQREVEAALPRYGEAISTAAIEFYGDLAETSLRNQ